LLRETAGSALIAYALVFPLFVLTVMGTVDMAYLLVEWTMANKAVYLGARKAVVSNPVARNITNHAYSQSQIEQLGQPCANVVTGQRNVTPDGQAYCPSLNVVCTPAGSGGTCSNGFDWDEIAFATIFDAMQNAFARLSRENVLIRYQTNDLGFVGQPGGLPMNVTISIACMTHQFYFIDAFMNWTFSPPPGCPANLQGPAIPSFASTLQSEDMATN
jgi:hypothetical protein